jgi:hypothetical protein
LHGRRKFTVCATELFKQHIAEFRIRFVNANGIHELLYMVIHWHPPGWMPANRLIAGMFPSVVLLAHRIEFNISPHRSVLLRRQGIACAEVLLNKEPITWSPPQRDHRYSRSQSGVGMRMAAAGRIGSLSISDVPGSAGFRAPRAYSDAQRRLSWLERRDQTLG